MKKYLFSFFIGLFSIGVIFFFYPKNIEFQTVFLKGKNYSVSYEVEIADTPQKAQQGLMYRKYLPQNQGMLFVFPESKIIRMWMKNTYIPLDMIFIDSQNKVVCLYENALPLDESIITCPYSVQKVLELNAGEIKNKKIQLGDFLS